MQSGIAQIAWPENFAYAEGYDAERGRYLNLKAGQTGGVMMDAMSLLVKPKAALVQIQREQEAVTPAAPGNGALTPAPDADSQEGGGVTPPAPVRAASTAP